MNRRAIPIFELDEYRQHRADAGEFAMETMENSFLHHPHRSAPHLHPFFQVFLAEGPCSLMHDFIDYSLDGTTLIFSSPGQVHSLIAAGAFPGRFISFSQAFYDGDTPPPSRLLEFPFFFRPGIEPLIRLTPEDALWCCALFAELHREYVEAQRGMQVVIRSYLRILFTRAARLYAPASGAAEGPPRAAQLAHQFRLAVEQHFASYHSLSDYAALLKVTPNHLNDVVHQEMGQSAGAVLRERQLLEAKRLLLHSSLSISEIAYALHFKDPSYFSRFFRRMANEAPGGFRRKIREKYHQDPGSHP